MIEPPLAVLAELTHRCPLQCPYCSNPLELERVAGELTTEEWMRVMHESADAGALQVHFSGGEPMARADLDEIVAAARVAGLYTNLITSGVLLSDRRVEALARSGLDHVQISFQDSESGAADRLAGHRGGHRKKMGAAAAVRRQGLPLTVNLVVHRQNLDRLEALLEFALDLEPQRIEVAHAQYYGWAFRNRAALMPTPTQLETALQIVEARMGRLGGRPAIDHVLPDYYARRPKSCMGGWGRRFMNVTPSGKVLPCHAAETIPGLRFENVRDHSLTEIWKDSETFAAFRGTDWMPEPCRSCAMREVDWGGCRCQALLVTGDPASADPACDRSAHHHELRSLALAQSASHSFDYSPRRFGSDRKERRSSRSRGAEEL